MLRRENQYNHETSRENDFRPEMLQGGYGLHVQGKSGFAGCNPVHAQSYGLMQFCEQPQDMYMYGNTVQQKEVVAFNVRNEIAHQMYATEVPEYAELVYVPDFQQQNRVWEVEQAPPLLRRPPTANEGRMQDSRNRSTRERAVKDTENHNPEIIIREVPVEKVVEVVKEVVRIVEVLKEVEVVKDNYVFKDVPVEKVPSLFSAALRINGVHTNQPAAGGSCRS